MEGTGLNEIYLYRLLAGGLALVVLAWGLERALASFARRGRLRGLHRMAPLLGLVLFVAYAGFALRMLFGADSVFFAVGILLLAVAALIGSRPVLKDVLAGIALRGEGSLGLGRTLAAGELRGQVRSLGWRSLILVAADGAETRVPYGRLAGLPITAIAGQEPAGAHSSTFVVPDRLGVENTARELREFLLLHPMMTPNREPEIKVDTRPAGQAAGHFEIQLKLYSYAPRFAGQIELDARRWIAERAAAGQE